MPSSWTVSVEQSGRGGSIRYREGSNEAVLDWEFAGGGAVALIFGPASEHWDTVIPWASGRQREVLSRVAEDVLRLQAPGCRADLDLDSGTIVIRTGK